MAGKRAAVYIHALSKGSTTGVVELARDDGNFHQHMSHRIHIFLVLEASLVKK